MPLEHMAACSGHPTIFCGGHALHAVDAALKLEPAVRAALPADGGAGQLAAPYLVFGKLYELWGWGWGGVGWVCGGGGGRVGGVWRGRGGGGRRTGACLLAKPALLRVKGGASRALEQPSCGTALAHVVADVPSPQTASPASQRIVHTF